MSELSPSKLKRLASLCREIAEVLEDAARVEKRPMRKGHDGPAARRAVEQVQRNLAHQGVRT